MSNHHKDCLVLNADFTPIGIIYWQKAMVWSFKYTNPNHANIEIVEYYLDDYIIGANQKLHSIPAVIKTKKYFSVNNKTVNFSRKNLFIRDNFTCQYCGQRTEINNLTYDHVIPKSKWTQTVSPTTWTNIVTACVSCNFRKGNRTPTQANMPLLSKPYVPRKSNKYLPMASHLRTIKHSIPQEWKIYISDFAIS
jgi:5-methylcytosine-specific restriction endonuclease McrA